MPGEILGMAGLQGSGRTELARALFGAPPADSRGDSGGRPGRRIRRPLDAMAAGIGFIPEDRQALGFFDDLDVKLNLALRASTVSRTAGLVRHADACARSPPDGRQLSIKMPSLDAPISSLSGGNQQKVLISRWLAPKPGSWS